MIVPSLGPTKDLELARYIQMVFLERLAIYRDQVVDKSPSLKTSGVCGDLDKLEKNAQAVITKIEGMLEKYKNDQQGISKAL